MNTSKKLKKLLAHLTLLLMMAPLAAIAAPITYYNLDFEDGTTGGGTVFPGFGEATNISPSNLDGRALFFELDDQMVWERNAADSVTHYVAFDYYAEAGANVTQFLDIPSVLRLDISKSGHHHIDVYYDLSTQQAWSYIDGSLDSSLLSILVWPVSPGTQTIRIINQINPPGSSDGIFEIDNLVWQGNVQVPVPAPTILSLFGVALVGMGLARKRIKT